MVELEQKQAVIHQYIAAFVVDLLGIGVGIFEGWISSNIILLTSDETPLPSGIITMEEASWIASLQCIGCMFGNICFGYVTNHFGRKSPLLIVAFPIIVSWLLIWFAQNVYYLYAARLLLGFFSGGAGFMLVPIFLAEISSDRIRGAITSTFSLSEASGIVLSLTISNVFDYYAVPKFAIGLTALFAVLIYFVPESPIFLVKQNIITEAEESIRFYKNIRKNYNERILVELEINKIKRALDDYHIENGNKSGFIWSDLTAQKAIIIGIVLVVMNQFTGVVAVAVYTAKIFQEVGSNLSPNISTIIVGIIQMIGTIVTINVVDRFGRKPLLLVSNVGAAFGFIVLGLYMMFKSWNYEVDTFNWIPITSLSLIVFNGSLGIISLPLTIIPEIMPEKIKDAAVSLCMTLLWALSFTVIKLIPLFIEVLQFHGIMFLFASVAVCCAVFIIFVIPETKGRSHEEIMESLK